MEEGIYFKPWVGPKYHEGIDGKKVMVLGHCHYCDDGSADEEFTNSIINGYIDWIRHSRPIERYEDGSIKDRWVRTYENFAKAFLGYKPNKDEISLVWERVLFYNYVQVAVPTADSKPSSKDYANSRKGFINVISEYEPDIIFVWGDVYNKTPDWNGKRIEDVKAGDLSSIRWEYLLPSGKKCHMIKIHHPSQGFSWEKWHLIIKKAME